MFNFLRKCQAPPQQLHHFTFPPATREGSSCSMSSPAPVTAHRQHSRPSGCVLTADFICIFLMVRDAEHLFVCLLDTCISFFGKCLLNYFADFQLGCLLMTELWRFFMYSGYKSLIGYMMHKYFLPFYEFSFTFLIVSFATQRFLFWCSPIYFFFGTISEKPLPNSRSQRFTPLFSSKCFHSFSSYI